MTSSFLPEFKDFPTDDPEELKRVLVQSYIDIAQAGNLKDVAQYETVETVTGQRFFNLTSPEDKRFTFRQCYSTGAIASGATATIAHNITNITLFTRIYGTCVTDVVDYRPLPFTSATLGTDQISLRVTNTDIIIVVGATSPNITSGVAVLE